MIMRTSTGGPGPSYGPARTLCDRLPATATRPDRNLETIRGVSGVTEPHASSSCVHRVAWTRLGTVSTRQSRLRRLSCGARDGRRLHATAIAPIVLKSSEAGAVSRAEALALSAPGAEAPQPC